MNNHEGCCSYAEFLRILKIERDRSKRLGSFTTYVVFDFSKLTKRMNNTNGEYHRLLRKMIILISRYTREYTIKYLFSPSKIRLLLIDLNIYDAKIFIEKISIKLYEFLQFFKEADLIDFIKVMPISFYSLNQSYTSQYTEINNENIKDEESVFNNIDLLNQQEIPGFFMSWNDNLSSDGIVSLTAPIFHDIFFEQPIFVTYKLFKRWFDILFSFFFMFMFSPFIIAICIAIKMTSKGPILFKQERLGYWGKRFKFLKFRTMYVDCETDVHKEYVKKLIKGENDEINHGTDESPYYKLNRDRRITPVGKILRKACLDEIPQFINVLKGDMSVIGPRPPIPYEIEEYKSWHFRRLFQVKPGITGLWQVSGRNTTTFDEMVKLDIEYAKHLSLQMDIKILLRTLKVVFDFDGK